MGVIRYDLGDQLRLKSLEKKLKTLPKGKLKAYLNTIEESEILPPKFQELWREEVFSRLPLGLPFRLPRKAWKSYGIDVVHLLLENHLVDLAHMDYKLEWKLSQKENLWWVAEAATKAGIGDANKRMNQKLGELISEVIGGRDEIRALDIGAGEGNTSLSLLAALYLRDWKGNLSLTITDVDISNLMNLNTIEGLINAIISKKVLPEEEKGRFGRWAKANIKDIEILPLDMTLPVKMQHKELVNSYDLLMANAALHHTPTVGDVLWNLRTLAKEKAIFGIGEWTHNIHINAHLQERALETFIQMYRGVDVKDLLKKFGEVAGANDVVILTFWTHVLAKAIEHNAAAPIWYLEGHLPESQWKHHLEVGGWKIIKVERLPLPNKKDEPKEDEALNTLFIAKRKEI